MRFATVIAFGSASVIAAVAPTAADPGWHVTPEIGTEFPIDVGVGVRVEAPNRVLISTTIGYLPGAYVDVINDFLTAVGAYSSDTATLIKSSLSKSLVWRTHVGYRPFPGHGFYAMGGYGFVGLGGSSSGEEVVEAATGMQAPATDHDATHTYQVDSHLHMLDVEVGWEWVLPQRLHVRAAIGGAFTVAASTTVTPQFTPRAPAQVAAFDTVAANYLDHTYTSYVFAPVATVMAGYSF